MWVAGARRRHRLLRRAGCLQTEIWCVVGDYTDRGLLKLRDRLGVGRNRKAHERYQGWNDDDTHTTRRSGHAASWQDDVNIALRVYRRVAGGHGGQLQELA